MSLNLQLVQRQTQRLIMTPQMQQSIQLLQMNSLELEQMLDTEMLENPFLELYGDSDDEAGSAEADGSGQDHDEPSAVEVRETPPEFEDRQEREERLDKFEESADPLADAVKEALASPDGSEAYDEVDVNWRELFDDAETSVYTPPTMEEEEERDFTQFTAIRTSLQDHLHWQLRMSTLDGKDFEIGEFLIGSIDDDGYLTETVDSIAEEMESTPAKVEHVLGVLQTFDPPGVFARNLPECLLLQLQDHGRKSFLATMTLTHHFESLQKKKFKEIAKALEVDESKIVALFNEIRRLEPKPGRSQTRESPRHITPDVNVTEIDGQYIYSLHEGRSSRLRISNFYRDMLLNRNGTFKGAEKEYAQDKLRAAVMLLKNIEKRKSTILRVTEAIMEHQDEFLTKGISHLRPLTLREIADKVGMHEATISRVTSGKYVETPQGLFELKFFFSSGIETDGGVTASSRSIKDLIADLISREDPKRPLSDEKIAKILHAKGFQIARRTVAKYREQMKILSAKLRKATD